MESRNHDFQGQGHRLIEYILDRIRKGDLSLFEDFILRNEQQKTQLYKDLANIDHLTQMPNRRGFNDYIDQIKDREYGMMIFDIDHFKSFNDKYGHKFGDVVLKTLSAIVRADTKTGDLIARWGGEEFAILMPGMTSLEVITQRAEEIRELISRVQIPVNNETVNCTVSIGVGINRGIDTESFFEMVDRAVFKAKEDGRNRVVVAQSS